MFGIQDSVFADNDGTILSEENPVVLCDYISANKYEYPNWLIISTQNKSEGQYTLTGVIRINEGTTYSVHCKLKDDYYAGCVCVGKYPIMNGDSILFRIEEIYGITKTGKVDILPLNTAGWKIAPNRLNLLSRKEELLHTIMYKEMRSILKAGRNCNLTNQNELFLYFIAFLIV